MSIEIPAVRTYYHTSQNSSESNKESSFGFKPITVTGEASADTIKASVSGGIFGDRKKSDKNFSTEIADFSSVFLQVFQIKNFIEEIQKILKILGVRNIMVLLDDFSEIEDESIRTFTDVVLAPLNNWSNEFIKFKIAAYPSRVYYGKIDPGKIDTINLDFYNLYSEYRRDEMEDGAINFTKRLVEARIKHFTKEEPSYFFDTSKMPIDEYYELLFQVSMNVPRIIGYILSYCYQSKIISNRKIAKQDIESASVRYFNDKIQPFFHNTTYSLISSDEKIDILQLKDLLARVIEKLSSIKRRIATADLSAESYIKEIPYSSHFHFIPELEKLLTTLELNYFISKYNEMSNKDGTDVVIYCLNYGLASKNNLPWGKPKGTKHRKYFIERPFNFTPLIKEFISTCESIHCTNPSCGQVFTNDQIQFLEFAGFKCNKCGNKVITEKLSDGIKLEINAIDKNTLLQINEMEIITELIISKKPMKAIDIAEELDLSAKSIGRRCITLDTKKSLVRRKKGNNNTTYLYEPTELAMSLYADKILE